MYFRQRKNLKNNIVKNIKFIILISFIAFFSCKEPLANFTEPQPSNKNNLSQFPKRILGNYFNPESGFKITIENKIITRTFSDNDTISINEYHKMKDENIKLLSKLTDTLYLVELSITDSIFNLKNGDILRRLNQNYFLNIKNSNENWNVSKLHANRSYLTLSDISNESEIELLNNITNQATTDSIYPKTYDLDKKQFKEFVKKNGFIESEIYIKQ